MNLTKRNLTVCIWFSVFYKTAFKATVLEGCLLLLNRVGADGVEKGGVLFLIGILAGDVKGGIRLRLLNRNNNSVAFIRRGMNEGIRGKAREVRCVN